LKIKLTKHAEINALKRNISIEMIEKVVTNSINIEHDKYNNSLNYFIGFRNHKFLRVIGRRINNDELPIVSTFYDRRLKRTN
jgi:hypothetical protein